MLIRFHEIGETSSKDDIGNYSFKVIYDSRGKISRFLAENGYAQVGFGVDSKPIFRSPAISESYLKNNCLIDAKAYANEDRRAVLRVLMACPEDRLEGVVFEVTEAAGIFLRNCRDFGRFDVVPELIARFSSAETLFSFLRRLNQQDTVVRKG